MLRGYRLFIVATLGCLVLLAIGAGSYAAGLWIDSSKAYPKYRETPKETQDRLPSLSFGQAIVAAKQIQPCRQPEGYDQSYLCTQWRSTDAAERASRWAWFQMVFSFFGIFGLVTTLWFNLEAWQQAKSAQADTQEALRHARVANCIAGDTARRQLRAYLQINRFEPMYVNSTLELPHAIKTCWENTGLTPSRRQVADTNIGAFPLTGLPKDFDFPPREALFGHFGVMGSKVIQFTVSPVDSKSAEEVRANEKRLFMWGFVEYDDAFEGTMRHRTEFCVEVVLNYDRITKRNSPAFVPQDRYNNADEDCVKCPSPYIRGPGARD